MSDPTPDTVYGQTCSDMRATDDISFKLMGIVPLVSGATILTLFLKEHPGDPLPVVGFALFAALVTLGLFRWELRNIQICRWLRDRAEALEKNIVNAAKMPTRPGSPSGIGKTEAEKWIYSVTIGGWLLVPLAVSRFDRPGLCVTYVCIATAIALLTVFSAFTSVRNKGQEKS